MESPDDVHYLKLEVLWHADSANGFDLTFFDKEAEQAERAIEQFVDDTIYDIAKVGIELYHSLMVKFARRARWASVFEKEIAAINVAAMIQSGMVIENDYNRITRCQRPLSKFAVDAVSDETKSLVKTTSLKIAETLSPAEPESRAVKMHFSNCNSITIPTQYSRELRCTIYRLDRRIRRDRAKIGEIGLTPGKNDIIGNETNRQRKIQ